MKNLVKSAFVALVVCVFAIPASAESLMIAPVNVQDTVVKKDTVVKEEAPMLLAQEKVTYTKIEVAEVPEKVAAAVTAKYEGYTTKEAAKGSDNSYKLIIEKGDSTLTVYFNEAGEFLKEEAPQKEAKHPHRLTAPKNSDKISTASAVRLIGRLPFYAERKGGDYEESFFYL